MISHAISIHNHGFVRLVDTMPSEPGSGDAAIVQAARVSTGSGVKTPDEDKKLIAYLMKNRHTSPFEMVELKFHCKMPIFIARQWIRHRTASVNEVSGRYSVLQDQFYIPEPEELRRQSKKNKQASAEPIAREDALEHIEHLGTENRFSYAAYEDRLAAGISREMSRINLPLSIYTEWYWKIDLHNLLHFLKLRCDEHAQEQIRVYADAMLELARPLTPWAVEAWEEHVRFAVVLSKSRVQEFRESGVKI